MFSLKHSDLESCGFCGSTGWHCFLAGSGCLLTRPLGSLYLKEQEASLQL